jgi:hypothetical protein
MGRPEPDWDRRWGLVATVERPCPRGYFYKWEKWKLRYFISRLGGTYCNG